MRIFALELKNDSKGITQRKEFFDIVTKSEREAVGTDITRGNWFFRQFILKPDTKTGIRAYEENKQ